MTFLVSCWQNGREVTLGGPLNPARVETWAEFPPPASEAVNVGAPCEPAAGASAPAVLSEAE